MTTPLSISVHLAESDADILRCFRVLSELRPHLIADTFLPTVRRMQTVGYFLVMLEADGEVAAVASYRFSEHLARGKFLYIDDLVTAIAYRRQGFGEKIFHRVLQAAHSCGCSEVHLDSGHHRIEAHHFYEKLGMKFSSRHYALKLT
jgi:ribosomal protein S18 acetylase RimI-like enzyme